MLCLGGWCVSKLAATCHEVYCLVNVNSMQSRSYIFIVVSCVTINDPLREGHICNLKVLHVMNGFAGLSSRADSAWLLLRRVASYRPILYVWHITWLRRFTFLCLGYLWWLCLFYLIGVTITWKCRTNWKMATHVRPGDGSFLLTTIIYNLLFLTDTPTYCLKTRKFP